MFQLSITGSIEGRASDYLSRHDAIGNCVLSFIPALPKATVL